MADYDLIIIGSGPAGLIAGIQATRSGLRVLILEKLGVVAAKLKASGGGKCNLTNTLDDTVLMAHFGRQGRFMKPALQKLNYRGLIDFFDSLGVATHAPDGLRVFPQTHQSQSIVDALLHAYTDNGGEIRLHQDVQGIHCIDKRIHSVTTKTETFSTKTIILATGGLGYPSLGSTGDGFTIASAHGHTTTALHPAMMPLKTQEKWVANCTADTIAKATILINIKGKKQRATGDLIFTKTGLRGPVILDFSREITPLLSTHHTVPVLVNLTGGRNEHEITTLIQKLHHHKPEAPLLDHLRTFLAPSVATELCKLAHCNSTAPLHQLSGKNKATLFKLLAWCPLTIVGHDGFEKAMITRGGIKLKEVNPETMESKMIPGLFFCGEILDLDGPCGGYNLTWCFSSGYLAGISVANSPFLSPPNPVPFRTL